MRERTRECHRACLACHEACLRAATYLQASEATEAHVRLLFNTADVVKTTASLLRGDLDIAEHAGRVCVELCVRAARYCDSVPDDATMRACAEACRACAEACQLMATVGAEIQPACHDALDSVDRSSRLDMMARDGDLSRQGSRTGAALVPRAE